MNNKVIICATIKNEDNNLKSFFNTITKIIKSFDDYYVILVESDSTDNTLKLAQNLMKDFYGIVISVNTDHLNFRTEKLSYCRNKYIDYIKNNEKLSKFDLLIIADVDKVNNYINEKKILNSLINAPSNWVGLFANQKLLYYDVWPLRLHGIINFDCYEKFINLSKVFTPKKSYFLSVFKYFFVIRKFKERYISVNSAFGGFGIYKLSYLLSSKYESNYGKNSEHVSFNQSILNKYSSKSLYIDKELINFSGINEHILKSIFYCSTNYFSQKLLDKFKRIYK